MQLRDRENIVRHEPMESLHREEKNTQVQLVGSLQLDKQNTKDQRRMAGQGYGQHQQNDTVGTNESIYPRTSGQYGKWFYGLKNACCKSSEDLKEIAHIPHLLSGHRISLHSLFPYCPKVQTIKSQMFSVSLFI